MSNPLDWDWDGFTVLAAIATLLVLIVAAIGITAILEPKYIEYYYLSAPNNAQVGFCVSSHWAWQSDQVVFCSDEKDKTLDFVAKANATLPKR